jgi:hypothetical protein
MQKSKFENSIYSQPSIKIPKTGQIKKKTPDRKRTLYSVIIKLEGEFLCGDIKPICY